MEKVNTYEVVYEITEEEVTVVERLFHEKTMHEAIINEIAETDIKSPSPTLKLRGLPIYQELGDIMKEYHNYVDMLIKKYSNNKYGSNDKWSIQFRDRKLIITTNKAPDEDN